MKRIPQSLHTAILCVMLLLLAAGNAAAQANCSGVPAWAPNTPYVTGALVTYSGVEYKCVQAHTSEVGWEPPNVPALWSLVGSCGSASTPTPTPTPKVTPSPTPTATPTPTSICGEPAWNANTTYAKGAAVGYNGTAWTALVANKGITPGTNSSVWAALARPCPTAPPPTATPTPKVTPTPTATATPTPVSGKLYAVADVGSFGGTTTNSYGVNDAGHVVGVSSYPTPPPVTGGTPVPVPTSVPPRAFLSINGNLTNLCGTTDVAPEGAFVVNLSDVVFGQCDGAPFSTYLGLTFPSPENSGAVVAVGSTEVGWAETASGDIHAFSWNSGVATDLGTLGGNWSTATGANNQGEIVGASITTNNSTIDHGFTWFNGTFTDLGANTYAHGINNSSVVVGVAGQNAFLYENGAFTNLGTLSGGTSIAFAINDSNQIVGASDGHAFLYQNGVMTDLNSLIDPALGITLIQSRAIARIGYIVADASNGHSYLLTPPSTVPLWQLGVAYTAGQQVYFGGHIYQCVQAHTSQVTEEPPDVPVLWRLIS